MGPKNENNYIEKVNIRKRFTYGASSEVKE